ncbi:hypothetical protein GDO78_016175 [Eleutherodactylus coqui]|uniref:Uncharacterized protein n=1 Tax=Eleutherodactylus coqui TaxID=57060 RepID=A0A8J6E659_ELECQ|nr:hypothetical protein GDO78_016175 [Eleutherodactylus coqui]
MRPHRLNSESSRGASGRVPHVALHSSAVRVVYEHTRTIYQHCSKRMQISVTSGCFCGMLEASTEVMILCVFTSIFGQLFFTQKHFFMRFFFL